MPKVSPSEQLLTCSAMIRFRDGDHHHGEANLYEIVESYHDFKLSGNTLLFIPQFNDWLMINEVLRLIGELDDDVEIIDEKSNSTLQHPLKQAELDEEQSSLHQVKKVPESSDMRKSGEQDLARGIKKP